MFHFHLSFHVRHSMLTASGLAAKHHQKFCDCRAHSLRVHQKLLASNRNWQSTNDVERRSFLGTGASGGLSAYDSGCQTPKCLCAEWFTHFGLQLWPASVRLITDVETVAAVPAKHILPLHVPLSSQPGVPAAGQSGDSFFRDFVAPVWGPENGPTKWPPRWVH